MLGERIKKIRDQKKMGLNETARLAGISGSYLSNIEKGIKSNPSTDTLQKIADALAVSINEFFDEDDNLDKDTQSEKISKMVKKNKIETLAAHFEGDDLTDDDVEDIKNFIEFIVSKKKNK